MYNLSLLTEDQRRDIELKRQAYLLKNKYVRKVVDRSDVLKTIAKLPSFESDKFRAYLNEAKGK